MTEKKIRSVGIFNVYVYSPACHKAVIIRWLHRLDIADDTQLSIRGAVESHAQGNIFNSGRPFVS